MMTDVVVTLTSDEALVLFDVLHRWEEAGAITEPGNDGERVALWNLSALLEPLLTEPFEQDYAERVAAAKIRLAGR